LEGFYVSSNQLTGSIPALTGLTALRVFYAYNNQLTGSLPALTGLTALQGFYVDSNRLTGSIPALTGLTALQNFNVSDNQLTGSIPALTGLTALWYFFVDRNQLTGPIPALTGLSALRIFYVDNNQLTGPVPALTGLSLIAGLSELCANRLTISIDPAWDAATGSIPWSTACTQTLSFAAAPALVVGGSGTVSVTVVPVPNLSVPAVYSSLTPAVCSVNASSGVVSVLSSTTVGSTCTIAANKSGGTTVNDAAQVTQSIVIGQGTQIITGFAPTSPATVGAPPATLSAIGGGSGNPIVFATTSAATICTVSGNQVSFIGAGTCDLTADQAGNANFTAASQVTASIVINAAPVTPVPTLGQWAMILLTLLAALLGARSLRTRSTSAFRSRATPSGTA
jgi:IPTL-CTERM motif